MRPSRAARGFSIIELAVSLGIFLVIAAMVSVSVTRSLSASSAVRADRAVEQSLNTQLTELTQVSYPDLLQGHFTVPDACPGVPDGSGIAGVSCVSTPAGKLQIAYRYQQPVAGNTSAAPTCADDADPSDLNDTNGSVGVCAKVVSINGVAAGDTDVFTTETSALVNAPTPGFKLGQGTVKVSLHTAPGVGDVSVFLVKTNNPTAIVSTAVSTGSTAYLPVPSTGPGDSCTSAAPCMLALSPTSVPNSNGTLVMFGGASSAGPGQSQSTDSATSMTQTSTGSDIVVGANQVIPASADVAPSGTARIDLLASDGSVQKANPDLGSVCLWVTFPDGPTRRTVPACNTAASGYISLDTYHPYWDSDPTNEVAYAFPLGVPLTLSVDDPDGSCYYAPGMQGATATGDAVSWHSRAVCTSYTWGTPTTGLETPIVLTPGTVTTRKVTWTSQDPADSANPGAVGAAGYAGGGQLWTKPRTALGCSTDATCASVSYTNLEPKLCPGQYCLSGGNLDPAILSPVGGYFNDTSDATTYTRHLVIADPEQDPFSLRLDDDSALAGWDVQYTLSADPATGTWQPWTAGDVLATDAPGPASLYVRYTRPAGQHASVLAHLQTQQSGSGWQDLPVTLGFATERRSVEISSLNLAQGGQVTLPFTITDDQTGAGIGDQDLTLSGLPTGMTYTSSSTNADGTGTVTLTAGPQTSAGAHTLSAHATDATDTPFTINVTQSAGTVSLSAAGGPQGGSGTATGHVLDTAGEPMPGVVVGFSVTHNGKTSATAYPAAGGCTTGADGSCTVALRFTANAAAGTYQVVAQSGDTLTPAAAIAVTAVAASARTDSALSLVRGTTNTYTVQVTDRTGAPVTAQAVTHPNPPPAGISVVDPTGTTTSSGTYLLHLDVTPATALGAVQIPIRVGSVDLTYPATVVDQTYAVSAAPMTLTQTHSATFDVTITGGGLPTTGHAVTFSTSDPDLVASGAAQTDSLGVARVSLTAQSGLRAGTQQLVVIVDGQHYPLPVQVTATPATFTLAGALRSGQSAQPVSVSVHDAAGAVLPDAQVNLSFNPEETDGASVDVNPSTASTDANGIASFTVDIPTEIEPGNYVATLVCGPVTETVLVAILPGT